MDHIQRLIALYNKFKHFAIQFAKVFLKFKFGWGGRIRTYEMTESKSVALPLGYAPIWVVIKWGE